MSYTRRRLARRGITFSSAHYEEPSFHGEQYKLLIKKTFFDTLHYDDAWVHQKLLSTASAWRSHLRWQTKANSLYDRIAPNDSAYFLIIIGIRSAFSAWGYHSHCFPWISVYHDVSPARYWRGSRVAFFDSPKQLKLRTANSTKENVIHSKYWHPWLHKSVPYLWYSVASR